MSDPRWIEGRVNACRPWSDTLFSLYVDAEGVRFEAGQFVKLALPGLLEDGGGLLGRPYSFVNPPQGRPHEFFCVVVPQGPLSPRLAKLQAGDPIYIARQPTGFLVLSEVPVAPQLWMICTGTGIGPFLSILRTETPWQRFTRIVLVQGTRWLAERTHRDVIDGIAAAHPGQFAALSLVTRQPVDGRNGLLQGRIPEAIADGRLEAAAGMPLDAAASQVMLCGNPGMIEGVVDMLKQRGMRKHRRRAPGHITVENYW